MASLQRIVQWVPPDACRFAPVLAVVLLLGACQTSSGAEGAPAVRASAFAFPVRSDAQPHIGRLEFRAGFVLASSDPRFGGLSGLWLASDGARLIAASDRGTLWLAGLEHADEGTLLGFAGWQPIEPGTAVGDPPERDLEALAVSGEHLVIAYEGAHRLRRLPLDAPERPAAALATPAPLAEPHNVGIEALVAMADGALLAIAEGVRSPSGDHAAWLIEGDRTAWLAYAPASGFAPTGADRLDDAIFVLERRVSLGGLSARVVMLDAADVRPGARLVGRELGVLQPPALSENFEGIAARRAPDGGVLLYLLSDDNFIPLMRTLLLQFALRPPS
jgi:hypothetical protein